MLQVDSPRPFCFQRSKLRFVQKANTTHIREHGKNRSECFYVSPSLSLLLRSIFCVRSRPVNCPRTTLTLLGFHSILRQHTGWDQA